MTIPVRWMPIREFPLDDPRTWEALAAEVHGFALVASVNSVFSRGLVERLRRDVQDGQAIVISQASQRQVDQFMVQGVRSKVPSGRPAIFAASSFRRSGLACRRAGGRAGEPDEHRRSSGE